MLDQHLAELYSALSHTYSRELGMLIIDDLLSAYFVLGTELGFIGTILFTKI